MTTSAWTKAQTDGNATEIGSVRTSVPGDGRMDKATLTVRARRLVAERRARHQAFPSPLFHEPGWDMMLALYLADAEGRTTIVKTLVGLAGAPATTAQRWIEALDRMGLVTRVTDPFDRRRIEVSLSAKGQEAMERYLAGL